MKVKVRKGGNMEVGNKPETIDVKITCVNGEIRCDPDEFEVYRGDFIEWSCEGDNRDIFVVIVPKESAFNWKVRDRRCGQTIRERIKEEGGEEEHKYSVIVTKGENVSFVDPIFIVRRH